MPKEKNRRKVWTPDETMGFLKCYAARKDEFKHSRKKIKAYQRVAEDMMMLDIAETAINGSALESRMRNLLIAYKRAKEHAQQTGNSPYVPPPYYMEQMEEIFGDDPTITNPQFVDSGDEQNNSLTICQVKLEPITIDAKPVNATETSEFTKPKVANIDFAEESCIKVATRRSSTTEYNQFPSTSATDEIEFLAAPTKRKNTGKEEYYTKKLELTKKHMEKTETQREEFLKDIKTTFKDHLRKMVDIEKRKVDLLQEFANRKALIKTTEPEFYAGNGF